MLQTGLEGAPSGGLGNGYGGRGPGAGGPGPEERVRAMLGRLHAQLFQFEASVGAHTQTRTSNGPLTLTSARTCTNMCWSAYIHGHKLASAQHHKTSQACTRAGTRSETRTYARALALAGLWLGPP